MPLRFALWACLITGIGLFSPFAGPVSAGRINSDCTYNGVPLYGKVKITDSFADFKVRKSSPFCDLAVKEVRAFADSCGEWEFTDTFEDFSVSFVDAFEDFSICMTDAFPGVK